MRAAQLEQKIIFNYLDSKSHGSISLQEAQVIDKKIQKAKNHEILKKGELPKKKNIHCKAPKRTHLSVTPFTRRCRCCENPKGNCLKSKSKNEIKKPLTPAQEVIIDYSTQNDYKK